MTSLRENYEQLMVEVDLLLNELDLSEQEEDVPSIAVDSPKRSVYGRIWHSPVIGVLVYSLMALAVVAVFLFNGSGEGVPRDLFGFSAMRVLTRSMQSEIPQHSLIVTRRVDPNSLQVGDDITFFLDETTVVTHRIVTVYYDHEGSGERAFQTQGIENRMPDHQLVIPDNIIGRVVFNNLAIGRAFTFVQSNLLVSGILAAMILGLFVSMRMVFGGKTAKPPKQLITE